VTLNETGCHGNNAQRREPDAGDISEAESEEEEVEENVAEDVAQDRLIKFVSKIGARERIEVPMYEGNLEVEELLDWVRAMENTSIMKMWKKTRW
jgi:hypothetical protein